MPPRYSYDREEPTPRGGWFEPNNTVGRRRAERAFRILAFILAGTVTLGSLVLIAHPATGPKDAAAAVLLTVGAFCGGAFAYFVVSSIGIMLTAVSWGDLFHDLRLRGVWAVLLEAGLFFSAAAMGLYSLQDAIKHQSLYSALVCALLTAMTWWPFIRHRIRHGRWPDQR